MTETRGATSSPPKQARDRANRRGQPPGPRFFNRVNATDRVVQRSLPVPDFDVTQLDDIGAAFQLGFQLVDLPPPGVEVRGRFEAAAGERRGEAIDLLAPDGDLAAVRV